MILLSMAARNQPDLFLPILMNLLMDEANHEIMRFVPDTDDRFEILKPHEFVSKILPYHFQFKMWGAFENKLLRYGFQQVNKRTMSKLEFFGYKGSTSPIKRSMETQHQSSTSISDIMVKVPNKSCNFLKEYDDTKMAILTRVMDENLSGVDKSDVDSETHTHHGFATFHHPLFIKGSLDTLEQIVPTVSRRGKKRKEP